MIANVPFFLALRYLRPRRSFVSVITLISVLGVMLGVGVPISVMAVFKGFQSEFRNLLLGFEPHVILAHGGVGGRLDDAPAPSGWREVLAMAQMQPGVLSAQPLAEGRAVIRAGEADPVGSELFGLRPGGGNSLLRKLEKHRLAGAFELEGDDIIITDRMAKRLKVGVGDKVEVYAHENIEQMIREVRVIEQESKPVEAYDEVTVIPKDLIVRAIVRADTAGDRCYTPLFVAQELFRLEDNISGVKVELSDPDSAQAFVGRLFDSGLLPPDWGARTWQEEFFMRVQAVENQKSLLYFLLFFIMLVAAICVMNTIITVTVQKRREIGILTAIGSPPAQVVMIFLSFAIVVAAVGVVLGIGAGMAILELLNPFRDFVAWVFQIDLFPQEVYFLSKIPAEVAVADVANIALVSVALCLLAALIPAWFAARVDPAVALRE